MSLTVREMMTPKNQLATLKAGDSVAKARKMMTERRIRSVLIKPSFLSPQSRIFTYEDLIAAIDSGENLNDVHVEKYASVLRYAADPNWDYRECVRYMHDSGVQHLPVMEDGEIIGIISSSDIINRWE